MVLRRQIEGVRIRKLPAVLTFKDFKKAFDSVHRGKMLEILEAYGIPVKILELKRLLYEKTIAKVLAADGETELFEILAGVLQGDTLAPYLFAIVIDYCMRQAIGDDTERLGLTLERRKIRSVGPKIITDVDFANDIALISEDIDKVNLNLVSCQLTDSLVCGQKFHSICQICVQKISYLKMGQTFENTIFRFVKLSAVGFIRPKSTFHHLNRLICYL